jgi:hypothetical protein
MTEAVASDVSNGYIQYQKAELSMDAEVVRPLKNCKK